MGLSIKNYGEVYVMKKRMFLLLVLTSLIMLLIAGCSGGTDESSSESSGGGEGDNQETEEKANDDEGETTAEVQLPDNLTLSTYDVGSSGYIQLTAIADAITKEYGTQIRLIPSASGIGRLSPLKDGTADFGGRISDEIYFSFEAIEEFATQQWGPQDVRIMYPIINHFGFLVMDDSKFETIADLKGAKVPYIIGNPALNVKVEGLLAAAGLSYDDVEVVEINSYGGQPEMMAQGKIDMSAIVPSAAAVYEADELYGVRWIDHSIIQDDPEALQRLRDVYPFAVPEPLDRGAALTEGDPVVFLGYTSYAPSAYADTDPDLVYNWLKALDETYDVYSQATDDMVVWKAENAVPEPLGVPIHEGGIRFFKEKGMWNDEYQKKNDELIERQGKIQEAWDTVVEEASEKGLSEKEFTEYWLERKAELVD